MRVLIFTYIRRHPLYKSQEDAAHDPRHSSIEIYNCHLMGVHNVLAHKTKVSGLAGANYHVKH